MGVFQRRNPDSADLVWLGAIGAAIWFSSVSRLWLEPLLEDFIDGHGPRGWFTGFIVSTSAAVGGLTLWGAGAERWKRGESHRLPGGLLVLAAVLVGSISFIGFVGRGPLSGSEFEFREAVPGYQDGTLVAYVVGFFVGIPISVGLWWRKEHRRRVAEGLPADNEHPASVAASTFGILAAGAAFTVLPIFVIVGIVLGLVALFGD